MYHKIGGHNVIFEISDEDIAGDPSYFGYLAETGAWIIQERNAVNGTYRYIMGRNGYVAKWIARATLEYKYYNLT
jgi:hypothetical protein